MFYKPSLIVDNTLDVLKQFIDAANEKQARTGDWKTTLEEYTPEKMPATFAQSDIDSVITEENRNANLAAFRASLTSEAQMAALNNFFQAKNRVALPEELGGTTPGISGAMLEQFGAALSGKFGGALSEEFGGALSEKLYKAEKALCDLLDPSQLKLWKQYKQDTHRLLYNKVREMILDTGNLAVLAVPLPDETMNSPAAQMRTLAIEKLLDIADNQLLHQHVSDASSNDMGYVFQTETDPNRLELTQFDPPFTLEELASYIDSEIRPALASADHWTRTRGRNGIEYRIEEKGRPGNGRGQKIAFAMANALSWNHISTGKHYGSEIRSTYSIDGHETDREAYCSILQKAKHPDKINAKMTLILSGDTAKRVIGEELGVDMNRIKEAPMERGQG